MSVAWLVETRNGLAKVEAARVRLPLVLLRPLARWLFQHTGMRVRLAWKLRPGRRVEVQCYGHRARLDSTFLIDGIYLLLGEYDADFDDFCRAALRPEAVIVDVGSHAGVTIFSALESVGDRARVYGFEPDPVHYQRCLDNLLLNPLLQGKVSILPVALSNQDGSLKFEEATGGGRGTYCANPEGTAVASTRSLDSWAQEEGLNRLDFLKCDVEGHEIQVFQGARRTIEKFRPLLFFESLFMNTGSPEVAELGEWMRGLDYVLCASHYPYPYITPGVPLPLDIIACPRDCWPELHFRLMERGQQRRQQRSRLRAVIDSWRNPLI